MKTSRTFLIAAPIVALLIFAAFALTGFADTHNEMPPYANTVKEDTAVETTKTKMELAEDHKYVAGYEYSYYEEGELEDSLPKSIFSLVNTHLLKPLRQKYYTNPEIHEDMLSRCPSGIFAMYKNYKHTDGYYYGKIEKYKGCNGEKICFFRATENELIVFNSDSVFTPADQYVQGLDIKKQKLVIEDDM